MPKKKARTGYGQGTWWYSETRKGRKKWIAKYKGKKKYFVTEQEAIDWLTEVHRLYQRGINIYQQDYTIAEWMGYWLEEFVKPNNKANTLRQYRLTTNRYIVPYLGRVRLSQLTVHMARNWLRQLREITKPDGTRISESTLRSPYMQLRRALRDAVRDDLIPDNPIEKVVAPRAAQREIIPWTSAEASQFLATVANHRLRHLYQMALLTGMRQGELISLRWHDIDRKNRQIHVRHNTQHDTEGRIQTDGTPKTRAGARTIPLTNDMEHVLNAQQDALHTERIIIGTPPWREHFLVFPSQVGTPLRANNLLRHFGTMVARAQVRRITFHQLRHTAISLMLQSGVPHKVASEIAGHSSIRITLDLYGYVYDEEKRDALNRQARLLNISSK